MESKVLGKGLSALIPEKSEKSKEENITLLSTDRIRGNSLQPRTNYDDIKLNELKASIKEKGVLQPILVREKDGGFEVIAGERRLRAARSLDIKEVPVIVKKVNDQEALVIALVENIQREELNPIEEAEAYKKLIDEFKYTQEEVAQSVGKDRTTITNTIRLLKLPSEMLQSVYYGKISQGHARALLSLESIHEQLRIFKLIIQKGLSVRETESLVKSSGEKTEKKSHKQMQDNGILSISEELQKRVGTKVRIIPHKKRGKIVIEYYSPDDLDRIIQIILK